MKPIPEYEATVPQLPQQYMDHHKKTTVKNQRLFLFEAHEKTGEVFGKSTSLNMRNFSNVQIGSSDEIRQVYERKAYEKAVTSPKMYESMKLSSGSEAVVIELNPLMKTSI